MEPIRNYILTVSVASMVTALVIHLTGGKPPAVKLVASFFLAICVLHPIIGADIGSLTSALPERYLSMIGADADWQAAGQQALRDGIQERTEAYILMEAEALGLQIDVEVSLTEDELPVPGSVIIHGALSPYQKTKLSQMLTADLGIRKEDVVWN